MDQMCNAALNFALLINLLSLILQANGASIAKAEDNETTSSGSCGFLPDINPDVCAPFWGVHEPPIILISLDGFRPEYLSRHRHDMNTSDLNNHLAAITINCLANSGVSAPYMNPSYPTITFPNHYSIVTGLYPESHQIIANQFYDPDLNAKFSIRNPNATDPIWWPSGEPLWTTVRKQGKVSATQFWPGSDVNFPEEEGRSPNYFLKFNKSTSFQERVDQVLKWLDLPEDQRPSFVTLYFEEPDGTGHKEGPDSFNVTLKVALVDRYIRKLIDGLIHRNIFSCVNIIIVSDHGMAPSPSGEQLVYLQKYVPDLEETTVAFYGEVPSIRPNNDTQEEEERIMKSLTCKDSHMRIFNKWDLPYRMHLAQSNRIPNLMLDMDLSWRGVFKADQYTGNGGHGWDNLYTEMQAIFIGHGPSLKSKTVVRPFENIQLYNLMCAMLNVTPAVNNGTWGALHHLLVEPPIAPSVELNEEFSQMPPILRIDGTDELSTNLLMYAVWHNACDFLNNKNNEKIQYKEEFNLNMTEERETECFVAHAPLGVPMILKPPQEQSNTSDHVLLVNEDYIAGFDVQEGVALWVTYSVNFTDRKNDSSEHEHHWIEDPRLEVDHVGSCQRLRNIKLKKEVYYTHLYPKEFATSEKADAWLDTNLLEVPSKMTNVIDTMIQLLIEAAETHGHINVISGPTRHHSPAIFYVIIACAKSNETTDSWNLTTCPTDQRELQAFLLPVQQWAEQEACMSERKWISFHVATLLDVERVTGLNFFPELPVEEKLNLLSRTAIDSTLVINPARS